ncbi:MAG: hypothetical protein AB8E87_14020 [Prochlorococcus sp.]
MAINRDAEGIKYLRSLLICRRNNAESKVHYHHQDLLMRAIIHAFAGFCLGWYAFFPNLQVFKHKGIYRSQLLLDGQHAWVNRQNLLRNTEFSNWLQ